MVNIDDIDWEWQQLRLKVRLSEIDGDAFENLFQTIASSLWGTVFQATIPMGSRGDLKCDGYHSGTGCVYQCYGPRYGRADVADAIAKVEDDFRGAKEHWKELMAKWTLVVGLYRDKVPSEILRTVFSLSTELGIPVEILSRDDIIKLASGMASSVRRSMFGAAPEPADMIRRITYKNIGVALAFVRANICRSPIETILPPPNFQIKVKHNFLSHSAQGLLNLGLTASERVKQYLLDRAEPEEADQMADGFSRRYVELRHGGAEPTEVFRNLVVFAGGATGDPDRDVAALAVVTHFFATCEIFERPPLRLTS